MTLEQIFYVIAISYFVIAFIFIVAFVVAAFIIYRRLKKIRQNLPQTATVAFSALTFLGGTKLKKALPVLSIIPLIYKGLRQFSRKNKT